MIKFEDKFVYFRYNDSLKGKKVFYSDSIYSLEQDVADGEDIRTLLGLSQQQANPFTIEGNEGESNTYWKFIYYDPNFECKKAYEQGKQIQFKNHTEWLDVVGKPEWSDGVKYRIKPSKPSLKCTDLKVGDIIQNGDRVVMVTAIDKREDNGLVVVYANRWLADRQLEEWRKVNG